MSPDWTEYEPPRKPQLNIAPKSTPPFSSFLPSFASWQQRSNHYRGERRRTNINLRREGEGEESYLKWTDDRPTEEER